ncbi:MAG: DUF167 family protein [Brevundimonas sp.]|uniref:DUF167 family protein n=1 Tax=Brevundimonas sp. TaxID=1871086 RepID=UPI00391C960E
MTRLAVRLTPKGGADRIDGWDVDAQGRPLLKARVRAAPADGKANAALVDLIARVLGVPRSDVTIARGAAARVKALEIEGLSEADVRARLDLHP